MNDQAFDAPAMFSKSFFDVDVASFDQSSFLAIADAVLPGTRTSLKQEALDRMVELKRSVLDGDILYNAGMADLGAYAHRLLESDEISELLMTMFGERYRLNEDMSCMTVYESGGYLGPHLDHPAEDCAVTVIVYIDVWNGQGAGPQTGPELRIYADNKASILEPPRQVLPTTPGLLVVGRGSQIWHERPPLRDGEGVIALTSCFRLEHR